MCSPAEPCVFIETLQDAATSQFGFECQQIPIGGDMPSVNGIVGVLLTLSLSACGGKSSSTNATPVPTPTPAPSTRSLFSQPFSVAAAPRNGYVYGFQDVRVPNSGQVQVTFDYTFASSFLDMVVTSDTCSDYAAAYNGQCIALGADRSSPRSARQARATFQATAATTIRIWVYNFSSVMESGVMNV